MLDVEKAMETARQMCLEDSTKEIQLHGRLSPTKNLSPLDPPWTGIEYEAMEKDRAKYFLYYCAVRKAVDDLIKSQTKLTCMVVGAGRGRLVDYCKDVLIETTLTWTVHVIEVNQRANLLLRQRFEGDSRVIVHSSFPIRTKEEMSERL